MHGVHTHAFDSGTDANIDGTTLDSVSDVGYGL
jgi:hypothetical protein